MKNSGKRWKNGGKKCNSAVSSVRVCVCVCVFVCVCVCVWELGVCVRGVAEVVTLRRSAGILLELLGLYYCSYYYNYDNYYLPLLLLLLI